MKRGYKYLTFFLLSLQLFNCNPEKVKLENYWNNSFQEDVLAYSYIHIINADGCEDCVHDQAIMVASLTEKENYLVILAGKNHLHTLKKILKNKGVHLLQDEQNSIKRYSAEFTNGLIYNTKKNEILYIQDASDYQDYFN